MERLLVVFLLVLGVVGAHPGVRHYILVREKKTWTDAQIYCREHYTDLATIDDMEDMNRITQNISSRDFLNVWIGLYKDKQNKAVFKWSDGSNSSFRHWGNNQPNNINEGCVESFFQLGVYTGIWNDNSCHHTLPFLCYKNVLTTPTAETYSQRIVFRVTTDVQPDDENPEIMAEILKQIHESLKMQGIAEEEMSLTWLEQPGGKIFAPEKQYRPPRKNTCTDEEQDTE